MVAPVKIDHLDIFILGAGRPSRGQWPAAIKEITSGTRILDWQIQTFRSAAPDPCIYYLGGYDVEHVIDRYPQINFVVVPDWENGSILQTFFKGPIGSRSVLVSYSDTVFRDHVIAEMLAVDADIVFAVDRQWRKRYEGRSQADIAAAEVVHVRDDGDSEAEFTGLVRFSQSAMAFIATLDIAKQGTSLIDLIRQLQATNFTTMDFDVGGQWAEYNSPRDIAHFFLGTKAETLSRLEGLVTKSRIGRQVSFSLSDWQGHRDRIQSEIAQEFGGRALVVRSSSKGEDSWRTANAGFFDSLLNVDGSQEAAIGEAVNIIFSSYGDHLHDADQVLVQEYVAQVRAAGVVFTCRLETGAPYYCFNFDDKSATTDRVTAGTSNDLRTVLLSRFAPTKLAKVAPELVPVLDAVTELEALLGFDKLDVEFAIGSDGTVHLFQVRPIVIDHSAYEVDLQAIEHGLDSVVRFIGRRQAPQPFIFGNRTVLANMPDWNPAEIIGARPKPLALSLYHHLITNENWAKQRVEFGYRDVRPAPLILSLFGQPYVDARATLNSFIPAGLPDPVTTRIAEAYVAILAERPFLHDKIEFDVAFTVWTPGLPKLARERLGPHDVTETDIEQLGEALRTLTVQAMTRLDRDIMSIGQLDARRRSIENGNYHAIDKIHLLIEDCRTYGTIAFAHAARSGFIATILLRSLVAESVITNERRLAFLQSFGTVMGDFEAAKAAYVQGKLSGEALISDFGHLRPGTYEVSAQAYWEDPGRFLFPGQGEPARRDDVPFEFTASEHSGMADMLAHMGSDLSPQSLIAYIRQAIQARERVKFEFTRNLSRALDSCADLGRQYGLSRDDVSYLEWRDLEGFRVRADGAVDLNGQIARRRERYRLTQLIELPSVIIGEDDVYCFERFAFQPNFVTVRKAQGEVVLLADQPREQLSGKIVLISQADPGYDWLFGHGIAGLVTKYGGANSHMAIRAAELGLPAAIGVGDKLFEQIALSRRIELDCANQTLREVH